MKVRESEEMYLETILRLKDKKNHVRSVDIVEELDYAKSSVSRAVNLLKTRGFIRVEEDGDIILTASGMNKAGEIYERHNTITEALVIMGADRTSAEENACRIEHVITPDMFEIIKNFVGKK